MNHRGSIFRLKIILSFLLIGLMPTVLLAKSDVQDSFERVQKAFIQAQHAIQNENVDQASEEILKVAAYFDALRESVKGRIDHQLKAQVKQLTIMAKHKQTLKAKVRTRGRIANASQEANQVLNSYWCQKIDGMSCTAKQCLTEDSVYQMILSEDDKAFCKKKAVVQ